MASCPFCSSVLLRHVRSGQMYWFCSRCRTDVLSTDAHPSVALSTPLDSLVGGSQTHVKLNESSSSSLTIHKD